jgi:two-component system chemotaxis sensor kinase CheA
MGRMMVPNDVMEQMREAFGAEALDLLIELDCALLLLEEDPRNSSLVNRVFRAIHTIKGSGATAGNLHLARFAHKMEEAFDLAREGRLAVSPDLIDCGLKACDVIRLILDEKVEGEAVQGEVEVTSAFARLLPVPEDSHVDRSVDAKPVAEVRGAFEIIFKPKREMFYSGADPVTLLDDLRALGQAHITAHVDQVPLLPSLEAEHCYLWWEILLVTEQDQAAIKDVFVFVEDECEVSIRLFEDQAMSVALLGSIPPEMLELFVVECEENLDRIERDALALEGDPASRDALDSLFRGVHSIKGNSGVLLDYVKDTALKTTHPLQLLLRVAHSLESLLDSFRGVTAGAVSEDAIHIALDTCDAMRTLLGSLTPNGPGGVVSHQLLEQLGVKIAPTPIGQNVDVREAAFLNTASQCVEMIADCLRRIESGLEPASPVLATYLRGLKTLAAAAQYRNCPDLEEPLAQQIKILDAATISDEVLSTKERSTLGNAFLQVRAVLDRVAPGSPVIHLPAPAGGAPPPAKTQADRPSASVSPATIRIDQVKLDRLMTVVGELLVARGAIPLLIRKLNDGEDGGSVVKDLKDVGSSISRIADELQNSVMSIRMLPVKTVFQRFPRLVRDLARSLGKEVQLVIEGEGIELDKTILEQIGDPLVHLIRNSVDHGFELPEERRASGKNPSGQLTLRAIHEAGSVSIEVKDDGRGLDADALKKKAVEKGLLTAEAAAVMSEEAAFQLVFLPGLSTAKKVTDVSGRGVGMDVVHSNVRNLQGTIEIRSKLGQGTSLLIKLPTSLMVSKGILMEAGGQQYILPLSNIRDMIKLPLEEVHKYRGQILAQVRGTIYSIFSLAEMLGLTPAKVPELSVVIVEAGNARYGLVVDKFLTEVEVLVKPLTGGLEQCKEFQGAAIMGDGRVVLVLNALECHSLRGIACN